MLTKQTLFIRTLLNPKEIIFGLAIFLVIYVGYHERRIEDVAGCWDCGWETRQAFYLLVATLGMVIGKLWSVLVSLIASIKVVVSVGLVAFAENTAELKGAWAVLKSSVTWSLEGHPEFFVEIALALGVGVWSGWFIWRVISHRYYRDRGIPHHFWRAWLLGGLYGLAVGILGAAASVIILEHHNTQTLDSILNQTYLTETPSLVPIIALVWLSVMIIVSCCVCFSFSSYLIHRLLSRRISSLYFLWQIIGLVAAVVWCGVVAVIDGTEYRRGRGSILRYDALLTRDFFVTALILFVGLVLLNFAYALLVRLALGQYARIQQTDNYGRSGGITTRATGGAGAYL